jgi:2-dehydropantoate 2-reductase
MKILILGAGGVGGYFGGRLAQSGADVTFLVRDRRKEQLDSGGLSIESQFGNANFAVESVTRQNVRPIYDLVILTCKAYDLDDALDTIAPAVGDKTVVLPLLNGVAHLARLNERFGVARVWVGTAKIAATLTPLGTVRHLNDWATITFGAQDKVVSAAVPRFQALLLKAGIDGKVSDDIVRDLWMKFVHLATVATMTSLMRASVGEINRTPEGKAMMMQVLAVNIEVATREGYAPDAAFVASYTELFSQDDSPYEASLLRDIEKGGAIEADHILGFMLARVRAHGMPDTIQLLSYTHAKAYEQRRAAGRLPARPAAA